MRIAVAAAILTVFCAGTSLAQAPAKSTSAKSSKAPPAKAVPAQPAKPTLLQLALQGDADAQFQLAQAYQTGSHGMKADLAQAASWLAIAAGNGVKDAAIELAKAYEKGAGVSLDGVQAAHWWRQAALLGDEAAKQRFLELFLAGATDDLGGPQGAQWLETLVLSDLDHALTPGDRRAILALGRAYEDGQGVPVDRAKASRWYRQAAFANDNDAKYRLGRLLLSQPPSWRLVYTDPAREVTNTDRAFYPDRASALQAAGSDRVPDMIRPGMLEAEYWLLSAARQDHVEAQYLLADAYLTGLDLPFSLRHGLHWLAAAAWNGHGQATLDMAELSARGVGFMAPDPVRAWVNYDLAAAQALDGAAAARDRLTLTPKQQSRAKQLAQELRAGN